MTNDSDAKIEDLHYDGNKICRMSLNYQLMGDFNPSIEEQPGQGYDARGAHLIEN